MRFPSCPEVLERDIGFGADRGGAVEDGCREARRADLISSDPEGPLIMLDS